MDVRYDDSGSAPSAPAFSSVDFTDEDAPVGVGCKSWFNLVCGCVTKDQNKQLLLKLK